MIDRIYIETRVAEHPRTKSILARYPKVRPVFCDRYSEVFNRAKQNFRVQKQRPALIIAHKDSGWVLPAPSGYGIGSRRNYYFSPTLNCLYDCRYCFLQGMYRSAHYVWFVNYEDFAEQMHDVVRQEDTAQACFFSGYQADSLALENLTGMADFFVEAISKVPGALLELRTKSINTKTLLQRDPIPSVVVAWSLTPNAIASVVEHGAPSVKARIQACKELARRGWNVGLRFDPVVYHPDFAQQYQGLFAAVFDDIPEQRIHSVSLGPMRFPKEMFARMKKLYPQEPLFHGLLEPRQQMISYPQSLESEMHETIGKQLKTYIGEDKLFVCLPEGWS